MSGFDLHLYDFSALQDTMERELPSHKRDVLICNDLPLHIAVTGSSGTGKSTFVNAFRGIDNKDERAAPTGVVETTMKPEPYPHPRHPNVTLWDLKIDNNLTCTESQYSPIKYSLNMYSHTLF